MDPHPSKLETNLDTLLSQMGALKQLKREAQRKGGRKTMKSWLQNVEAKEHELDQIQRELEQLKTLGLHRDKFYVRHNLNKRVIECLSVVEALKAPENTKKVSRDNGNCMEMWISELEMLKPQRYSYDQLINIITADVIIGQGGFGEVYKGKICKVEVAVKVLKEHEDKIMEKQFMNEMRTMFSTSHQHLVKFYGYCFEPEKKALIYGYTENGSLDKHLYKKRGGLPWDTLYNIAIGTAKGIAHLHESDEKPIIHYDIKAANVLLDSNYSPKVTDFGLSKMYEKDVSHVIQSGIGGTTLYAAPEVSLRNKEITFKCDVFSFGLMLLEILRRKRITKNENCWFPLKVWESLQNGMLENLLLNCGIEKKDTKQAERFAIAGLWCVQFQPKDRPHMSDVVKVLQGVMQLPSDPPNPDTSSMFASAHGTAHERATSAGSYVYDERSTVVDDDDDDDDDDDEEEEEEEELKQRFHNVSLLRDHSNFVVAGSYVYDERDDDDGGGGGMFGSAYGAAPERATLDGAYFYDERNLGTLVDHVKDGIRNQQQYGRGIQPVLQSQHQNLNFQSQQILRQMNPQMPMVHPQAQNIAFQQQQQWDRMKRRQSSFQQQQQWDRMKRRQSSAPRPAMSLEKERPIVEVKLENMPESLMDANAFAQSNNRHPQMQFRQQQTAALANLHAQPSHQFKQLSPMQGHQFQTQSPVTMRAQPVKVEGFSELMGEDMSMKHDSEENKLTSPSK